MKTKDIAMYILGAIITIGFFATLIFMIVKGTYESSVNLIVGALVGSFTTIVAFFYGSSKGSADKTEMIHNSTPIK
jgi:drug/metabolite transporter (DMT)-like permease